jgi:YHS domain-containing protein
LESNQTSLPAELEFKTVCGGKIKNPSKYPSSNYEGEQVYFCTQACLETFLLAPDPFMTGEIEHQRR